MGMRDWFRRTPAEITETTPAAAPTKVPTRAGFEYGIPPSGLNEYSAGIGTSTQTDRRSLMQELHEAYLSCPWSWASVQAIARTITAGGLVTEWDSDDGEGDQDIPEKPANVLALERFLRYCNPTEDFVQIMRRAITDLEVFGDAFLEVTWLAGIPVAIYNLDCPTMFPIADEHGTVSGYAQVTEFGQRATFEVRDVIHIALDSPRSGVLGVSPTQAALLPITSWLFAASTGKETFRKGVPPQLHVDFPATMQQPEMNRWLSMFSARNIGPRNLGNPITTRGGATVNELQSGRIADMQSWLDQKRDEIIACYGVPPAQAGIIESGNLGGGTGESQFKMFMVNTCGPIAALVLEKLNFHVVWQGFGIEDWHLRFKDIDWRDSKTIEDIYEQRVKNGGWTLNRYRAEIGEPPVDGGDIPAVIERSYVMAWSDIELNSKANIIYRAKAPTGMVPQPMADKMGLGPQVPAVLPSNVVAPYAPPGMFPMATVGEAPPPPEPPQDPFPPDPEDPEDPDVASVMPPVAPTGPDDTGAEEAAFRELLREAWEELSLVG